VVDYVRASSRPPSFIGVVHPAEKTRDSEVVDYTSGGHATPGTNRRELDYSRVPGSIRQDRVKAAAMARQLDQQDAAELGSWDELQARNQCQADDRMVNFARPVTSLRDDRPQYAITNPAAAGTLYGSTPAYGPAAAGQAVRVSRPQQRIGPQRVPHIVN